MALKAGFREAGLQLFEQWSRRGSKYRRGEPLEKWRSFKNTGIGLGTLFYIAEDSSGFTLRTSAEEDFAAFKDEDVKSGERYPQGNSHDWQELKLNLYVSGVGKNQELRCAEGK